MLIETELLMRQLAGIQAPGQKHPAWLDRLVSWISSYDWVNQAYAAGSNILGAVPAINVNVDPAGISAVNSALADLNKGVGNAGAAIGNAGNAVSGLANQVGNVGTQIGNVGTQIGATGNAAIATVDRVNANATRFNDNFARLNDTMSSESKVAKLAFSAGAGYALGSLAISLAATGVSSATDFLVELVTHRKEKAEILQRFIVARESYEKSKDAIKQLEQSIDAFGELNQELAKLGVSRAEFISKLGPAIERTNMRLKFAENDLEQAMRDGDQACAVKFSEQAASLRDLLSDYKNISSRYKSDSMCGDMEENLRKLKEAEGLLQQARMSIVAAQDVWNEQMSKQESTAEKGLDRSLTIDNTVLQSQLKQEDKRREQEMAGVAKDVDRLIQSCMDYLSQNDSRWFFASWRRKSACRKAVEGPEPTSTDQVIDIFGKPSNGDVVSFEAGIRSLHLNERAQKLADRRRQITETYDNTVAKRTDTMSRMSDLKKTLSMNQDLARGLTDADNEWFAKVLQDQANAGDRARVLQEKEKMITTMCGPGVPAK
jgi:hypothetical protein